MDLIGFEIFSPFDLKPVSLKQLTECLSIEHTGVFLIVNFVL